MLLQLRLRDLPLTGLEGVQESLDHQLELLPSSCHLALAEDAQHGCQRSGPLGKG